MTALVSQVWIPVAILAIVMGTAAWYYLRKDLADKAAYAPPAEPEPEADPLLTDHPTLVSRRLPGGDCVKCKRVAAEPLSVWCGACEDEIRGSDPRPLCLRCERFPQNFNSPWCVGCGHDVDLYDSHDLRTLEEK
jgi:hypothetical protein